MKEKKISKLIKGGVGIKFPQVEKFQKINNRGGMIIRNLRAEIKVTPRLKRVKDFLLENHGFEFC